MLGRNITYEIRAIIHVILLKTFRAIVGLILSVRRYIYTKAIQIALQEKL